MAQILIVVGIGISFIEFALILIWRQKAGTSLTRPIPDRPVIVEGVLASSSTTSIRPEDKLQSVLGFAKPLVIDFIVRGFDENPQHRVTANEDRDAARAIEGLIYKACGIDPRRIGGWLSVWGLPEAYSGLPETHTGRAPWEARAHNLVVIGSTDVNAVTTAILTHPDVMNEVGIKFLQGTTEANLTRCTGLSVNGTVYESPSFAGELADYAIILRIPNPWHPKARALVVAGVRGFGTEGAAKFLFDDWPEILGKASGNDFVCVVRVESEGNVASGTMIECTPLAFPPRDRRSTAAGH